MVESGCQALEGTQNQRKTLKISGKKCIFTNNRLKIISFGRFILIGYLSAILIGPSSCFRSEECQEGHQRHAFE